MWRSIAVTNAIYLALSAQSVGDCGPGIILRGEGGREREEEERRVDAGAECVVARR